MKTQHKMNAWHLPILVISTSLSLVSCSDSENTDPIPANDAPLFIGYWEQTGYGQYVEITPETVLRFEASTDSCIKTHSLQRNKFPGNLNWTITRANQDSFTAYLNEDTSDEVIMDRVIELPASCDNPLNNTPVNVINHLIAMASDYYAFFSDRNIDWDTATNQARAVVHEDTTDQELIAVMAGLLSVLNDGHVFAHFDPIDLLDPVVNYNLLTPFVEANDFRNQLIQEYINTSPAISFDSYELEQTTLFHNVISSYMDNDLIAKGGIQQNTIKWGAIDNSIGYLQVGELDSFDPDHAGDFLSESANPAPHLLALNTVLDDVIADLQHTSAIVLDLRLHSGGTTVLDRTIAQRFIDSPITYGSFSAPGADSIPLVLEPYDGNRLSQPVLIITSGFNASSGEDLIMALKAKNDTTQIGEATRGIFSDQLFLSLPNQWAFSLSNETWLDQDGLGWEAIGLQPDHALDVFATNDRQQGMDSLIELAVSLLVNQTL